MMAGHVIIVQVKDGGSDIADSVPGGISKVGLTGQKPDLHPITVGKIEETRGHHCLHGQILPIAPFVKK